MSQQNFQVQHQFLHAVETMMHLKKQNAETIYFCKNKNKQKTIKTTKKQLSNNVRPLVLLPYISQITAQFKSLDWIKQLLLHWLNFCSSAGVLVNWNMSYHNFQKYTLFNSVLSLQTQTPKWKTKMEKF